MKYHWILAGCLIAGMGGYSLEARRPNVVLIMADDLGYECLRCNGGTSYDSTLLDRMARDGMRFTHCYSQPICTPSRNKIMTGRSNARNYIRFGLLDPQEVTFGHLMKTAGYRTCVAGKWQLSGGKAGGGTSPKKCGFEQSCMWAYKHNLPAGVVHTGGWERKDVTTSRFWHPSIIQNGRYRPTNPDDYGPTIFTDFIVDFLKQYRDDEFFVYFPMTLTHGPFLPTPHSADLDTAERFKSNGKYFGDMIKYTGHCVQRILNELDELGIAENTLVLFTTDNGTHRSLGSNMGERFVPGGKGIPVDAGCHVPMLAVWKGKIKAGSVCTDLIDFSDFLPTIAEIGKASIPSDREMDGRSFLPQLLGRPANPRDSVFVHYDKDPQSKKPAFRRVRFAFDGTFKLYMDGAFYNVPKDVDELSPIRTEEMTREMRVAKTKLQAVIDGMPKWRPDNSNFSGGMDRATSQRRQRLVNGR